MLYFGSTGVAAPSVWFEAQGYSRQLLYKYVQSGWLVQTRPWCLHAPRYDARLAGSGIRATTPCSFTFPLGRHHGIMLRLCALSAVGWWTRDPLVRQHRAVPAWLHSVNLPQTFHFHARQLFDDKAATVGLTELPTKTRDWTLNISPWTRHTRNTLSSRAKWRHLSFSTRCWIIWKRRPASNLFLNNCWQLTQQHQGETHVPVSYRLQSTFLGKTTWARQLHHVRQWQATTG